MWDPSSAAAIVTLEGHQYQITAMGALPTGEIVSASLDKCASPHCGMMLFPGVKCKGLAALLSLLSLKFSEHLHDLQGKDVRQFGLAGNRKAPLLWWIKIAP